MTQLSEIIRNPHFRRLATLLRVPFLSSEWRATHPTVPVWTLDRDFDKVTPIGGGWNREEVLTAFTKLLTAVTAADPRLSYSPQDIEWFVGVLDAAPDTCAATIKLLHAYAWAPDEMLTAGEVAALTGTSESLWRNRAAAGEIPGAIKKGKTWLLPRGIVLDPVPAENRAQFWTIEREPDEKLRAFVIRTWETATGMTFQDDLVDTAPDTYQHDEVRTGYISPYAFGNILRDLVGSPRDGGDAAAVLSAHNVNGQRVYYAWDNHTHEEPSKAAFFDPSRGPTFGNPGPGATRDPESA